MGFKIYINYLEVASRHMIKLADDTKILRLIHNRGDATELQNDLETNYMYGCKSGQIGFNTDKCTLLYVGHGNPQIDSYLVEKLIQTKQ